MKSLITLSLVLFSMSSLAHTLREVTCQTVTSSNTYARKTHTITFQFDQKGNFVKYSEYILAKADRKDVLFGLFGQSLEDSAVEYVRTVKSRNGYSIVTLGTTAEEIKVGVYRDFKSGFYSYKDAGSGNGDSELSLSCSSQKN